MVYKDKSDTTVARGPGDYDMSNIFYQDMLLFLDRTIKCDGSKTTFSQSTMITISEGAAIIVMDLTMFNIDGELKASGGTEGIWGIGYNRSLP